MGGTWEVGWDGSFQPNLGAAGVGITFSRPGGAPLVSFSVPVYALDATRTEALGPALANLLLVAWFSPSRICFRGDSAYVVGLLDRSRRPSNIWYFNCLELTRDLLTGWVYRAIWVPRELNAILDLLARQAVMSGNIEITLF